MPEFISEFEKEINSLNSLNLKEIDFSETDLSDASS
jgi:hypothetical protein